MVDTRFVFCVFMYELFEKGLRLLYYRDNNVLLTLEQTSCSCNKIAIPNFLL